MSNILYSFRRCPYAMRARMALSLAEAEYEHREILLRDKPSHMLQLSPKGSVPVFITGDKVIDESLDIMRWALPDVKFDMDIIRMIDGPFKHHLDRYKYASRYDPNLKRGNVDLSHRSSAVEALNLIEEKLNGGPFLHGATMGPTDMATFPFVRQFAAVEPEWWSSCDDLMSTQDWLARCLASDIFSAVMQKFPIWSPEN